MKIVLASASPRRSKLLEQLDISHDVCPVDIDETALPLEAGHDYVQRLACKKARAAFQMLNDDIIVIAADTTIVLDSQIIGKPENQDDFVRTFGKLSGRNHNVMTGLCILSKLTEQCCTVNTVVRFRQISAVEVRQYWQTGEPMDKAGGYAIQGIGAMFVESISGSYSSVVGLPLMQVSNMLALAGYQVLDKQDN